MAALTLPRLPWVRVPTPVPHTFKAAVCHLVTLLKSKDTAWCKTLWMRSDGTVFSAALSPNETSVHYSLASLEKRKILAQKWICIQNLTLSYYGMCFGKRENTSREAEEDIQDDYMSSSYIHPHGPYSALLMCKASVFQRKELNILIENKYVKKQRKKHFLIVSGKWHKAS